MTLFADAPAPTAIGDREHLELLKGRFRAVSERAEELAKANSALRQRELAAKERAAELELANQALRKGVAGLGQLNDLSTFLEEMLKAAVATAGAHAGGVVLLDEEAQTYRVHPLLHARGGFEPANTTLTNPFPIDPTFRAILDAVKTSSTAWLLDPNDPRIHPEFIKLHEFEGNLAVGHIPMCAGDRLLGVLGLGFATREPEFDKDYPLLRSLADQMAMAVEMVRLSEEAKSAAVAREREQAAQQRASELAHANEALTTRSKLLSVMAEVSTNLLRSGDFVRSLNDALRVVGETIGLSRVLLLERYKQAEAAGCFEHRVTAEWCAPGIKTHSECGFNALADADAGHVLDDLISGKSSWYRVEEIDAPIRHIFERLEIKATGCTPLFIGGLYAGAIAFDDCVRARTWEAAQVDALMVAANAVSAVLQARHDAERLSREREKAAQEQAAELVKANHALRSSVDDLVTQTTTDGILTSLLKQAIDISGANSGAILKRIVGSEFEYVTIYADGAIRTSEEILAAGTNMEMRLASRLDPTGHFTTLARGEAQSRDIEDQALAKHLLRSTAFHNKAGTKRIYDFPYQVAGQVFGYLGLAFADSQPPSETVQETIKALATQVGLALEFRRISDQVERAAIVEERNKFARDLHDTLAQGFAAILMQLGAAEQAANIPTTLLPYLDRVDRLARTGLAEARSTVSELRTSERIKDALPKRLSELARRMESTFGYLIQLRITGTLRALPFVVEDELYLIAQESLTNAMKHAEASEVKLDLEFCDRGLRLKVKDNGRGFSADERNKPDHFGLQTMQERSQRINAKVTIISEPGFGTEILTLWNEPSTERS